jgi:uncharacterized membrane protein YphA (DoxX/SURF4 family)
MPVTSLPMIDLFLQILLALVFGGAALSKLQNADEFHGVVRNFRLVPEPLDGAVAFALPWVELGIAASLLTGIATNVSGAVAGVLLVVFAIAIAINIFRGRTEIDCGCFRQGMRQRLNWALVARNMALSAGAFWLAAQPAWPAPAGAFDVIIGALAAAGVLLLYLCANELVALRQLALARHNTAKEGSVR